MTREPRSGRVRGVGLLGGIAALLAGAIAVAGFFALWDRGVQRCGRKADAIAVSAILAFLVLVALAIVSTPPI
jgi:hypothetical protein